MAKCNHAERGLGDPVDVVLLRSSGCGEDGSRRMLRISRWCVQMKRRFASFTTGGDVLDEIAQELEPLARFTGWSKSETRKQIRTSCMMQCRCCMHVLVIYRYRTTLSKSKQRPRARRSCIDGGGQDVLRTRMGGIRYITGRTRNKRVFQRHDFEERSGVWGQEAGYCGNYRRSIIGCQMSNLFEGSEAFRVLTAPTANREEKVIRGRTGRTAAASVVFWPIASCCTALTGLRRGAGLRDSAFLLATS